MKARKGWRARGEYLGQDDYGNHVYRIITWNPYDPDDNESFLHIELVW